MRDTNLASPGSQLPMGFMFHWYESFDQWLEKRVKWLRRDIAERIEATARELGLEGFKSSLRRDEVGLLERRTAALVLATRTVEEWLKKEGEACPPE